MPSERSVLSKIQHRNMNNEGVGILISDEYFADHILGLLEDPTNVKHAAMAALAIAVYDPYHAAILSRNVSAKDATEDVDAFIASHSGLKIMLKKLEAKVVLAFPLTYVAVIKKLNLSNITVYTNGKQAEQILAIEGLKIQVAAMPELATAVVDVNAMIAEVKDTYSTKETQVKSVGTIRKSIPELKAEVAKIIYKNWGTLTDMYFETPFRVADFFNIGIIDRDVKWKEHIYKGQYNIIGAQGVALNIIDAKFGFGDYMQADCKNCPVDIWLFLASEITSVVPLNAQKINKGDRIIFKIDTIGSSTQKYLMVVFATDPTVTEECEFKLTIDAKKTTKKNIIHPVVAVPIDVPPVATTLG